MNRFVSVPFVAGAMLLASPAVGQQTPASSATAMPAAAGSAVLPAIRHLVYRFGYNTKAASEGKSTGTTTIDIVGLAPDGGMTVNATDDWWNAAKPRQTYTCEVYPNGGVKCGSPAFALSPIQLAVVPLLGKKVFAPLSSGPTSSWTQTFDVRATFFPGASGFAGQVYTWNCSYTMNGKGALSKGSPLLVVESKGAMKQKGGRYNTVNQQSTIAFDPRIHMPVFVDEVLRFVPPQSVNRYTVQLKLIRDSAQ